MFDPQAAQERADDRIKAEQVEKFIASAADDPCVMIPKFVRYLDGIGSLDRDVLGRIWSFQRSGKKYFLSLSTCADNLAIPDRQKIRQCLRKLLALGYITKSEGLTKGTFVYDINLEVCISKAIDNGYPNQRTNLRKVREKKGTSDA